MRAPVPTKRKRKPKGAKHHSARPGQPVRVVLRDGTVILGTFKRHHKKYLMLNGRGRIPWEKVRMFGYLPTDRVLSSPTSGTP